MKKLMIMLTLALTLVPNCKANANTTNKYILYGYAYNANCSHCGNEFIEVYTDDGNVWTLTGTEIKDGQRVRLRMDSKGTKSVLDDEIVKIRVVK